MIYQKSMNMFCAKFCERLDQRVIENTVKLWHRRLLQD